jgi:hypothetical protein
MIAWVRGNTLVQEHELPCTGAFPLRECGDDVVARRMGVKDFTVYNATIDPNHLLGRQGEYTSKINWGQDRGNGDVFSSIEAFPDAADAHIPAGIPAADRGRL